MTDFAAKAIQITIAAAVMMLAIYIGETTDYPINPYFIGAWAFMAAYAITMVAVRVMDYRQFGWMPTFPSPARFAKVTGLTIIALAVCASAGFFAQWLQNWFLSGG